MHSGNEKGAAYMQGHVPARLGQNSLLLMRQAWHGRWNSGKSPWMVYCTAQRQLANTVNPTRYCTKAGSQATANAMLHILKHMHTANKHLSSMAAGSTPLASSGNAGKSSLLSKLITIGIISIPRCKMKAILWSGRPPPTTG